MLFVTLLRRTRSHVHMEVVTNSILVDEESRLKRRASAENWTANKKRAVSLMADSPVAVAAAAPANGVAENEEKPEIAKEDEGFPNKEQVEVRMLVENLSMMSN